MSALLSGMLLGFAFIAPIGMQNLYVFNNAVNNTLQRAMLYVLFVWLADSSFSIVAYFGMGAIINSNDLLKLIVMILGGALVIYIGWTILRSANQVSLDASGNKLSMGKAFATAFIVTWANPQALVDGSLMLGATRAKLPDADVWPFIIGVLIATALWFTIVTVVVNRLKNRLSKRAFVIVNVVSGLIMLGYGLYFLYGAVQMIMG
ncbi:Lysine permease [Weissella viridescens]|uniref:Amino acid export protein n=3 Tax=Weissella TaxID=46255 RepID=A0A0R2H4X0_WEIVI|nr:LysE family transporter [Weissella viridescens]KRN46678.1 amino acid export protein [Weissella viridescens]MBX4172789.1 LysE family transporter [Weissella viridescens]MCB6840054.1 LysE family transporter [Weissella viridescens]MCB6846712.1 LysE family transporter [Weissella viridescens]QOD86459.1 LysE family transporter [Weissella viridescens]